MDEQTPPPGAATGAGTATAPPDDSGPRVSGEQVRDFSRLRRSRDDRYVGGVAGGLGRHLDVDPTVVRVVLVVLSFFGGAGLLLYLAIWLLVPEDGSDRATIDLGGEVAKVLVIGAGVVAALIVLGIPWGGSGWPWVPWPLLVVVALVVWVATRRREERAVPPPPPAPAAPAAASAAAAPATAGWEQSPAGPPTAPPTAPSAWVPPPPPRQRRTGLVLFWPTLAAVVLALGVLGLVDVSYDVPVSAYAALTLAVIGLGLLVGAFAGRPGGLIALGLVAAVGLAATSAADSVDAFGPYRQQVVAPATTAPIDARDGTYLVDSGDFTLDLTRLDDLDELDGRTLTVQMDVGELSVVLPEGLNADVTTTLRYAGEASVDGDQVSSGMGRQRGTSSVLGDSDSPTVGLDLILGTGQIDVTTR
ncbi:PspC domain-containing protein [Nocardioides aequoreus]|uniref:PspC domain-containing protein n=1 Tax=Nocardioides aequoreus TaxID=397278 RepID=UPI0004C3D7C1|nr:PspC domain-containing protein [Nocardioides aequoreus]